MLQHFGSSNWSLTKPLRYQNKAALRNAHIAADGEGSGYEELLNATNVPLIIISEHNSWATCFLCKIFIAD